ncbi:MAG: rhamnan synthesis F family protein [Desulfovibrio sp.]|jgi:rhamnosyltransferase|nr:rhamnan synthesis F family protein [Desulfovibrio sp.]
MHHSFVNALKYPGVKIWLKTTPAWAFICWCARGIVHALPLPLCRIFAPVPWLGRIAVARLMAQESCAHWFNGSPGKQVDIVPGLNAGKTEAVKLAWSLLPRTFGGKCSIIEYCRVIKGADMDFSGKKVVLLAHWDPENWIDPFVDYALRHFQQAGFMTILASAALPIASEEELRHADAVVYRTCGGYDFTSWKGALECFPSLRQSVELLLTNDSVFAPLNDIGAMHAVMDSVDCDFWGLLESRDQLPAMPSFYMVFRAKALRHPCFEAFWNDVDTTSNKELVVRRFEQSQALWFALNGLIPGAYIHWGMMPWLKGGPAYACWKQLVQLFGVPCIKRAVVNGDVWWADITGWEELVTQSGYPLYLIRDFLARRRRSRK